MKSELLNQIRNLVTHNLTEAYRVSSRETTNHPSIEKLSDMFQPAKQDFSVIHHDGIRRNNKGTGNDLEHHGELRFDNLFDTAHPQHKLENAWYRNMSPESQKNVLKQHGVKTYQAGVDQTAARKNKKVVNEDIEPMPNEPKQKIEDFVEKTRNKYPELHSFHVYPRSYGCKLDSIIVKKEHRNKGIGGKVLQDLTDFADEHKHKVTLQTGVRDPHQGTTSATRLKKFYSQFGFKENKGRNKDYSISDNMIRNQKGQ